MGFIRKHIKFITYAICGILATLVNSFTFWLFTDGLDVDLSRFTATSIAWAISVLFAFITNKLFVFKSKSFHPKALFSEGLSFFLARLGTGILDVGIMTLLCDIFKLAEAHDLLDDAFKILSTLVVTVFNYFVSEFLVFRKKRIPHFARLLLAEGVEYYSCIPLSKCKITKPYLLLKNKIDKNSNVIVMLFPYRTRTKSENLTAYASVKDYHAYVDTLSEKLEKYISRKYPTAQFKVFSDHSPIDEVHAACISGLGFMGDNGLLINEKYSSFVFVGECITNLTPKQLGISYADEEEMRTCLHCGLCKKACPSGCIDVSEDGKDNSNKNMCLSAITQKKGELTESEAEMMVKNGSVWGCDVCQNVCPYTKNAKYTPIKFFSDSAISRLDSTILKDMTPEEFTSRPFAWRGYETIRRNVLIWEKAKKKARQDEIERQRLIDAEERVKMEITLEIDAVKDVDISKSSDTSDILLKDVIENNDTQESNEQLN